MKVCDLPYSRITEEIIQAGMEHVLSLLSEAGNADQVLRASEA